ncbi:MAG: hypothetical protein H6Q86_3312 [candidate division NC10 bacterium]|jgi:hypothetical protein|nr:hypothetical protein [candidate division NC10 bacterium]
MRSAHSAHVSVVLLAAVLLLGATMPSTREEAQSVQRAPSLASVAQRLEASRFFDEGLADALVSEVIILLLCAVGCGLLVAAMEGLDLWRERREEKAARLHTRIAKALQRDGLLGHLAVTPIVHPPRWGWSQATIELRGHVPTVWLRYAILRATEQEAATSDAACHIVDRIMIVPSMEALAL